MKSENKMPKILFGSFQMSDSELIYSIVSEAASNGIRGFDTSPSYRTELDISKAINRYLIEHPESNRADFYLQSKIDAWQMIQKKGDIRPFVNATLKKIDQPYFDLLLIHWPQPDYFVETWKYMEKVYESGQAKAIGICNCQRRHIELLKRENTEILPMVIQNEIHPLNTDQDNIKYFKELGITVQAYSPLCRMISKLTENQVLIKLAEKYKVSIAQIILRWHIENGIVPIVKTSKPQRVMENIAAMNFEMDSEDVQLISMLNENFKIFLESRCCPGY